MSKIQQPPLTPSDRSREFHILYCDGACSGNPGPGGWGTILLTQEGTVQELGGFDSETTNNRMELTAALVGLKTIAQAEGHPRALKNITLFADSLYVIRGMTEWIRGWKFRGWVNSQGEPVANRDLWEELSTTIETNKLHVRWSYVPGHAGIPGNERADAIAVAFAKRAPFDLFQGPVTLYPHDLESYKGGELPQRSAAKSANKASSAGAYYISYVNSQLEKHTTWKDCEARVKGRAGAKFKKVNSRAEEEEFLKKWGLT